MKKLYQKSELTFAIIWIVAYCVLLSLGDAFSEKVGISKAVTLPIAAALSIILFILLLWKKFKTTFFLYFSK